MDVNLWLLLGIIIVLTVVAFVVEFIRRRNLEQTMSMDEESFKQEPEMGAYGDGVIGKARVVATVDESGTASSSANDSTTTCQQLDTIVVFVAAFPGQSFAGYELLQSLSSAGLRHGDRNIFHAFDDNENLLFSVASADANGAIDVDNMGGFSCQGLCLFLPEQLNAPVKAFERMLITAHRLAEDLNGRILDQNQQPLTTQMLESLRQQLEPVRKMA